MTMRGVRETPEERYATLERIARALERIADAGEARNRMAEEAMRRHERIETMCEDMKEVSE